MYIEFLDQQIIKPFLVESQGFSYVSKDQELNACATMSVGVFGSFNWRLEKLFLLVLYVTYILFCSDVFDMKNNLWSVPALFVFLSLPTLLIIPYNFVCLAHCQYTIFQDNMFSRNYNKYCILVRRICSKIQIIINNYSIFYSLQICFTSKMLT